ncbi:uncharacterized protein BKA78DRAFT_318386 [Phyllosticta capitalensis]|uniref:uncharacterized protein n=1 Tax=Phyllosticta capitalensis TaxID=121624 RepID=UPI003130C186
MAEEASTPSLSLKARIAALNLQQVQPGYTPPSYGNGSAATNTKKKPPPPPPSAPPPRLAAETRSQTANAPPIQNHATTIARGIGNQPAKNGGHRTVLPPPALDGNAARPSLPPRLPSRTNSRQPPPSLPPRKSSSQSILRKDSQESISTIASAQSMGSARSGYTNTSGTTTTSLGEAQPGRIRAPQYDPSKLPALPPKKTKEEREAELAKYDPVRSKYLTRQKSSTALQPVPSQPPSLPSRPALPARPNSTRTSTSEAKPRRSALEWGLNKSTETPPALPTSRPSSTPGQSNGAAPPPIPLSSRPDLASLQASKPRANGQAGTCLKCRDFRAVDAHAARFPRESIPSHDLNWLAHELCDPFPSLTDKARAIFTWLHHNIDYNCAAFFGGCVQPSTPANTISSGLAVCEGYAGLFSALAAKVGLESVVIGGHGKGFGYAPLAPGSPVPQFSCGHAWNAVRIDGGEWKLIDACWGAGSVDGASRSYKRHFTPSFFIMDNNEFGMKHYPEDSRYFFRTDGRATVPWEEYILAPPGPQIYGAAGDYGLNVVSFQPWQRDVRVHSPGDGPVVRFQFEKRCPHYDPEALGEGKQFMYFVIIEGRDGRNKQWLPMEHDGRFWWCDIERAELGVPGQGHKVLACAGTKWLDGPEGSGRGVTRDMWERDRYGIRGYNGVACWDVA